MLRRRLHRIRTGNGRATNWSFVARMMGAIDTRPVHVSRMIRGGQGYALGRPGEPIEADGTWQTRPRAA